MHISEGVLPGITLAAGAAVAAAGVGAGLKKMDHDRIPRTAVLSAALFVASLIHVPVGYANVHLSLNGLAGLLLGWSAFPALLISLFLQAILFQYGGLTTLGVNTFNMALPAVLCAALLGGVIRKTRSNQAILFAGFAGGAGAVVLSTGLLALSLWTAGEGFIVIAGTVAVAHLPVAVLEGLVTGSILVFLKSVKPEALESSLR